MRSIEALAQAGPRPPRPPPTPRQRRPPRPATGLRSMPRAARRFYERTVLDPTLRVSRRYVARLARNAAEADARFDYYALLLRRGDVDPLWNAPCLVACARNWLEHAAAGLPCGAPASLYLAPLLPHVAVMLDAVGYALCERGGRTQVAWSADRMAEAVAFCASSCIPDATTSCALRGGEEAVATARPALLDSLRLFVEGGGDPALAAALAGSLSLQKEGAK